MGAGRAAVRHLDHLVPGRRRFLYRLHRDRRPCAGLCGRRLRLLRAALYHHRLSLRLRGDAGVVEGGARQRSRQRGGCGARQYRLAWSRTRRRHYRHGRDHALYRAATDRDGRGDQGDGSDGRIADRGRLHHSGIVHLQFRAASPRADRLRQGHHDLYRGAGGGTGLILKPEQMLPYATLALGSALAAFMYPHTLTGIFASKSADTIRKNAILLPAYTLLLGLIALLGYMAHAAHIVVSSPNDVVPTLFAVLFPPWFAGFSFSAIAIGALVPAAVMSIGSANLFTRNIWKSYVNPDISHAGEASVAKIASLVVKVGALAFIISLPTQYALDLQLLGGLWILQTFPALVFGLFTRWFRAEGLLLGWAMGTLWGSWTAWSNGLKPLATIDLGGVSYGFYVGLGALILNVAVAAIATLILEWMRPDPRPSAIVRS